MACGILVPQPGTEPGPSAVRVQSPNHWFSSVQFSRSVVSDSLRPHEVQQARPPWPSPTAGVYPNRQRIPPPQPLQLLSPRPPWLPLADFSEAQTPLPQLTTRRWDALLRVPSAPVTHHQFPCLFPCSLPCQKRTQLALSKAFVRLTSALRLWAPRTGHRECVSNYLLTDWK